MEYLTIDKKMTPPLPDPIDWVALMKWVGGCVSGLFGFRYGVDQYFKYLNIKNAEKNKILRLEKEDFIKSVVNSAVTVAIQDIHNDVKELKLYRESDMKYIQKSITDIYRDMKK